MSLSITVSFGLDPGATLLATRMVDNLLTLSQEIRKMTQVIDDVVAANAALKAEVATATATMTAMIGVMNTLKTKLDDAIAQSGISAADQARLQGIVADSTAEAAALHAASQSGADATAADAPSN